MSEEIILDDAIKAKLSEAVMLWADENLIGKPSLLATAMYFRLEAAMIENINEIKKTFN